MSQPDHVPDNVAVHRQLRPEELHAVGALVKERTAAMGQSPLSEQKWLDLQPDSPADSATLLLWGPGGQLQGFAQLTKHPGHWVVEVVVQPSGPHRGPQRERALLQAACSEVAAHGGGQVEYWIPMVDHAREQVALTEGFSPQRDLLQLRRSLPVPDHERGAPAAPVRPFRPGLDEEAWLAVNNRAFAGHPEQADWDLDTLVARQREDWFDPAGFLLHFEGQALTGFCWTKVHAGVDPPLGEIYVISVDPDHHGAGLGRGLVLAGLDFLAREGLAVAMLYVDADNQAARGLYDSLGFKVHHVDRAYSQQVPAA